jgi:hypothetical protein
VPQCHNSCMAVAAKEQLEEAGVEAAVQGAQSHKGKGPKWPQQKALGRCIDLSKHYHAKFGEQAKYCEE